MRRKQAALAAGYRRATRAELARLGFSPGSRRYVRAAAVSARTKSYSRRAVEQELLGRTFERAATARAIATKGRSRLSLTISGHRLEAPLTTYDWFLQAWAHKHGQSIGEARSDKGRQKAWRTVRTERKKSPSGDTAGPSSGGTVPSEKWDKGRRRTRRYLDALYDAGIIDDEQYDRYSEE